MGRKEAGGPSVHVPSLDPGHDIISQLRIKDQDGKNYPKVWSGR